jgi:hypothetical protein
MESDRSGGAAPAPRIVSLSPGGHVPPGADVGPGAGPTRTHRLPIPPDPGPDRPADYYLAVGVGAGVAAEQHRHVFPVTTRPPVRHADGGAASPPRHSGPCGPCDPAPAAPHPLAAGKGSGPHGSQGRSLRRLTPQW